MSSTPAQRDVFKHRLREARRKADLSKAELARRVGINDSAISHYEKGRAAPGKETCARLEDALGLAPGDLGHLLGHTHTGDDGEPTSPEVAIEIDQTIPRPMRDVFLAALREVRRQQG
jgi:transcriptional regulator with XRE-family HTH domain